MGNILGAAGTAEEAASTARLYSMVAVAIVIASAITIVISMVFFEETFNKSLWLAILMWIISPLVFNYVIWGIPNMINQYKDLYKMKKL
jgi:uncharacterized membrane protein YesL